MSQAAVFVATNPLFRLARTGEDIGHRRAWYEAALARHPAFVALVREFVATWRARNASVALCSLMARTPGAGVDPLAFLRLLGEDVARHPDTWSESLRNEPELASASRTLVAQFREVASTPTVGC